MADLPSETADAPPSQTSASPSITPKPGPARPSRSNDSLRVAGVLAAIVGSFALIVGVIYGLEKYRERSDPDRRTVQVPEAIEPTGPQPVAVVEGGTTYNFGEMSPNQTDSHTFVIRNDGETTLQLEGGRSTCKCTLSDLEVKNLEPGESTEITLTYTPKAEKQEWAQQAVVMTNDPNKERILLQVEGAVLREVFVMPDGMWEAGPISEDETPTVGGHVFSSRRDNLEILEVLEAPEWVDVTWGEPDEGRVGHEGARSGRSITVAIAPTMPIGRFTGEIKLKTNIEAEEIVMLGIGGSRSGPVTMLGSGFTASRMELNAGKITPGEGAKRPVSIMVDKDEPFDMIDYSTSNEAISVTWEKRKLPATARKDQYVMTVVIAPSIERGIYEEDTAIRLDVETNNPDVGTLPIKVKMRVR